MYGEECMRVYLNGHILNQEDANINVFDRGLLFGDGVFETIRAYEGKPFRLDRHLARLREGCRELRISGLPEDAEITEHIYELYSLNVGKGDAYVRITVTGGEYDGSKTLERPSHPNIVIVVMLYEGYPQRFYDSGVHMVASGIRRSVSSPLSRIKSNNYLATLMAKQEARDKGADDAVMLSSDGYLVEGTSSNLFLVSHGEVFTPDVACGLLPGITRETVIELCQSLSLHCSTGYYSMEDLVEADEVFLTVSTGEVVPVCEVDGMAFGETCPGPLTLRVHEAYRDLVREELGLG
jgi:branched-chain amino acid aminotransferase